MSMLLAKNKHLKRRKNMAINTSERQFESDIEAAFLKNGYRQVSPSFYDKETAVFPNLLK